MKIFNAKEKAKLKQLHSFITNKDLEQIENFPLAEINLNRKVKNQPIIYWAICNIKDPKVLKKLVDSGADSNVKLNLKNSKGNLIPILSYAIEQTDISIVSQLLNHCDINIADSSKNTPLHYAIKNKKNSIVRELIRRGAKINQLSKEGHTPLDISIMSENSEITLLFLELGAKSNSYIKKVSKKWQVSPVGNAIYRTMNYKMFSPASDAVVSGNFEELLKIVKDGVDINWYDGLEITLLMYAAASENSNILRLLLALGANINARDINGQSAFDWAKSKNRNKNIKILREIYEPDESFNELIRSGDLEAIQTKLSEGDEGELLFFADKVNFNINIDVLSKDIQELKKKFPGIPLLYICIFYRWELSSGVKVFSIDNIGKLSGESPCILYEQKLLKLKEVSGFYCVYSKRNVETY